MSEIFKTKPTLHTKDNQIKKYSIFYCELEGKGSVQGGKRPCIIVSNDIGNRFSSIVTIVPITSRTKRDLPTHLNIFTPQGIKGIALGEQIQTIPKDSIQGGVIATLDIKQQVLVNKICQVALGL